MKDFFVSYNSADRRWGEWIAWQLEEAGYSTVIQAWDSLPGDNFVLWMQKAASEAKQTIAVLSQAYIDALFTQPEWAAAFRQDPTGAKGTLLPVRVQECDLTGLLPSINYIDLVGLEEGTAKEALLTGVKRKRIKPSAPPSFPGDSRHSLPQQPGFPGLLTKRSAIKFLRPFGFDDAELYVRLQRETSLRECLEALLDRDFRLGVLSAESGCGKTSFLQAGIWPAMNNRSGSHHAVYVKFTDSDPSEIVRSALHEQTKLSQKEVTGLDFLSLLHAAAKSGQRTLMLLFDQFEQFFVHNQRQEQRQPFIDALAEWYRHSTTPPVKILLSIRSDFFGRLVEVQKALRYNLRPQDLFELNKFTPAQATEIFAVMAETADLSFDRCFVEEMTGQELAAKEDGLISPVDIQILAWMIQVQHGGVKGGFNKQVYQKVGGIDGLLENFLSLVMKSLISESQREVALKILLSLVDLDGNASAGVLTRDQIGQKLAGKVRREDLKTGLTRLAESRLITPGKRNGGVGYELAHERLIPALRRFAGKELSEVERVNQMLERRVNEWLGNERSKRYFFSLRELWLVKRQRPYLRWGKRKSQKEELLRNSRRWLALRTAAMLLLVLLPAAITIGLVQMMSPSYLSEEKAKSIILEKDYYDVSWNKYGKGIQHDYDTIERHGQKLVIDHATSLTWQQDGSENAMNFKDAKEYVQKRNDEKYGGYDDWRLPTLEEAMSLMEPQRHGDLHLDPVFDREQRWIWTADKESASRAWVVFFYNGY